MSAGLRSLACVQTSPPPSVRINGEKRRQTSLLPIFSDGAGTSVHRLAKLGLVQISGSFEKPSATFHKASCFPLKFNLSFLSSFARAIVSPTIN